MHPTLHDVSHGDEAVAHETMPDHQRCRLGLLFGERQDARRKLAQGHAVERDLVRHQKP